MACALKGKVPRNTIQSTNIRKKMVSTTPNSKYGCPKDFIKLSEYMCVNVHQDKLLNPIESVFDDSQIYCKNKNIDATLLYFLNPNDALRFWKWSGKLYRKISVDRIILAIYNRFNSHVDFVIMVFSLQGDQILTAKSG